jgi:hypothetical protein
MTSGMSRKMGLTAEEKKDEAEQHEIEPGAEGPGIRDWFGDLPKAAKGSKAAAFDTRGDARMAGGAAHGIARRPPRVRPGRRAGGVHHRGHRGAVARG